MAEININETTNTALENLEESLVQFKTNYTQTVWADGQQPAINATNLSKIEGGIGSVNTYLNSGNRTNIETLTTTIRALRLEEKHRIANDVAIAQSLLDEESRAKTSEASIQSEIGELNDAPENQVVIGGDKVSTVYGQLNSLRADYQNLIGDDGDAANQEPVYIKVLNEETGKFDTIECQTVHSRIQSTIDSFNSEIESTNKSIGTTNDASGVDTVHGRIKKLEEFVGESDDESDDTVNRGGKDVPTVNARVRKVEEHIGKSSDTSNKNTVHGRIQKVEDFIGEHNDPADKKVTRGSETVPTVNARIQEVENHIGKSTDTASQGTVHGRITNAEESIKSQYTTLTGEYKSYTDTKIAALDNTLQGCTIAELNTATNVAITDHERRITDNESRITDHEERITEIETSANFSSISALTDRVNKITLYDMNDTTDSYTVILDGGELS